MGAPQLSWPTGLLTRVVIHGSWGREEIQRWAENETRSDSTCQPWNAQTEDRAKGLATLHVGRFFLMCFERVGWFLGFSPPCTFHIFVCLQSDEWELHTCAAHAYVYLVRGPCGSCLHFRQLLVTWLMQGYEHRFFHTAAAHRKAAAFGLQGDSQASYLGNASSLSSGLMTWGSVLLWRTLQVFRGNSAARSFSVGSFPVSETENFYRL